MAEPRENVATVGDDTERPVAAQTEISQPSSRMEEHVVTQEPTGSQEKVHTEEPVVTQGPTGSLEEKEDQIRELTVTQETVSPLAETKAGENIDSPRPNQIIMEEIFTHKSA